MKCKTHQTKKFDESPWERSAHGAVCWFLTEISAREQHSTSMTPAPMAAFRAAFLVLLANLG